MGKFKEFLKHRNCCENYSIDNYFSINESGECLGLEFCNEDFEFDWNDYREFYDLDEGLEEIGESKVDPSKDRDIGEYGKPGTTFGGELIIDMDSGDSSVEESQKDILSNDTEVEKYIKKRVINGIKDVQDDAFQYKISPVDGNPDPQTGKITITRREFYKPKGTEHELSKEEIQEILSQMNKKQNKPQPAEFSFSDDDEFLKNGKTMPRNLKTHWLAKLNSGVEKIKQKKIDSSQRHYRWEVTGPIQTYTAKDQEENPNHKIGQEIDGTQYGDRLRYNLGTKEWDPESKDTKKYEVDEYDFIKKDSPEAKELLTYIKMIQNLIDLNGNPIVRKTSKSQGNRVKYGWDDSIGTFTVANVDKDGNVGEFKPIIGKNLISLIKQKNAGMTMDKRHKGSKEVGGYWKHFKISMTGSKVGDVANFSLPPVITCHSDAPCINDGCYAIKAYSTYPTTRISQEVNYALLREGKYEQLREEINNTISMANKSKKGPKIKYFRFFVSGDMFSSQMLDTICNIATDNGKVNFWMYTKQYKILHEHEGKIPDNLTILISCWGDYRPKYYGKKNPLDDKEVAPYAELEGKFPLAYLDDDSSDTKDYFTKTPQDMICPCTSDDEVVARCDTCHKCFEAGVGKGNIIFRKH